MIKKYFQNFIGPFLFFLITPKLLYADALDGLPYFIGGSILIILILLGGIILSIITYFKNKNWSLYLSLIIATIGLILYLFFLGINSSLDGYFSLLLLSPSVLIFIILFFSKFKNKFNQNKFKHQLIFLILISLLVYILSSFFNSLTVSFTCLIITFTLTSYYFARTLKRSPDFSPTQIFIRINLVSLIALITPLFMMTSSFLLLILREPKFFEVLTVNAILLLKYLIPFLIVPNVATLLAILIKNTTTNNGYK